MEIVVVCCYSICCRCPWKRVGRLFVVPGSCCFVAELPGGMLTALGGGGGVRGPLGASGIRLLICVVVLALTRQLQQTQLSVGGELAKIDGNDVP